MDELKQLYIQMKEEQNMDYIKLLDKVSKYNTLTEKCVIMRRYSKPQQSVIEKCIKHELNIKDALDNTSGDGFKNGIKYEIKTSIHTRKQFNFVQIRPNHNIDYYILIGYNIDESSNYSELGIAYIFKIPSNEVYKLVVEFGSYAHGTIKKNGKITNENIINSNYEYALRCNKKTQLWNELLKYKVEYDSNNF